jgi:hypothetical protein
VRGKAWKQAETGKNECNNEGDKKFEKNHSILTTQTMASNITTIKLFCRFFLKFSSVAIIGRGGEARRHYEALLERNRHTVLREGAVAFAR